jgi:hypothetical protein
MKWGAQISRRCSETYKGEPTTIKLKQLSAKAIAACGDGEDDENTEEASPHNLTMVILSSAFQDAERGLKNFKIITSMQSTAGR